MNTHKSIPQNRADGRESLEAKQQRLLEHAVALQRASVRAWVGVTAIALVATVALLASCGHEGTRTRAASYPHEVTPAPQQNVIASSDGLESTSGGVPYQQSSGLSDELKAVPPDAVVAVSDTFVTAGQPVEVTAEGTADVTEMALSDGRGDALPMVRDSSGNVWRVNYRVPLRPKTDRLGLAVTAKNESNRWRRVWLFLQIDDGRQQVGTGTPEAGKDGQR